MSLVFSDNFCGPKCSATRKRLETTGVECLGSEIRPFFELGQVSRLLKME
jgi:hypothetical protein